MLAVLAACACAPVATAQFIPVVIDPNIFINVNKCLTVPVIKSHAVTGGVTFRNPFTGATSTSPTYLR